MKKRIKAAVVITLILTGIYFGTGQHINKNTSDCLLMEPFTSQEASYYRQLDLSEKTRLSFNKFGFRKKIVISEDSVMFLEAGGPPKSHVYYGLFKDKELRKPIEVIDFKWLYKDDDFEEGKTDVIPYDEERDGIVTLQPGTYYAVVYTESPFDDFEASYLSYIVPLNESCKLAANETATFYIIKDGQKNTFEITSESTGKIEILTSLYNDGTIKVYDEDRVLVAKGEGKKNADKAVIVTFNAEKGHTYYAEIDNCKFWNEIPSFYHEIKYKYI